MTTLTAPVTIGDRMTRTQKVFVILRDHPEVRDSYDLIISQYYRENPLDWVSRATIERDIRCVQYDMGIYPPSAEVRKQRMSKKKEIIAEAKAKKRTLLARAWDFIRKK